MPSTNDRNPRRPVCSLWLEVHHADQTYVFCCAPEEERAIVLGSLPRADIRVSGPRIAPVHFHFEREGDRILLVPTYSAEVCVNSKLVRGRATLPEHAVIEFAGFRIEARVRATAPEQSNYRSLDIPDRESGISYLAALPSDTQTTKLALDAFSRTESLPPQMRDTPSGPACDLSRTQRIERLMPELQTTQIMERLQVVAPANPAAVQHTARMERVAAETFRAAESEPSDEVPSSPAGLAWQETTAFDLEGLKADLAPTPVSELHALPDDGDPPASTHMPAPVVRQKSAPPRSRGARSTQWGKVSRGLFWVGALAKAQPLAVAAMALGAAVGLALLMLGISHIVIGDSRRLASPRAQVAAIGSSRDAASVPETPRAVQGSQAPVAIAPTPASPPSSERAAGNSLATAVSHLVAGRYVEARAAYSELGRSCPENPAYLVVSQLLERRTSGACSGDHTTLVCPEVVR